MALAIAASRLSEIATGVPSAMYRQNRVWPAGMARRPPSIAEAVSPPMLRI